ncbi:MAG: DegT/DnrJ/EryC1/StrS family aminotransferase [Sedimentisphaerales bacterium]|nr:DegT/DnrJ/EryC1/StrS family aminotransferase [Sedimentisphaerales bacterium]
MTTSISKSLKLKWSFLRPKRPQNILDNSLLLYQGRYAFYTALSLLGIHQDDEVLMPAFHCLSMVEPIIRFGCRFNFYRVSGDLQATVEDLEAVISNRTRAVILVHYFGLAQRNLSYLKTYLQLRNVYLIEDCAHIVPMADVRASETGDVSIYSPRKFLPLIDGALLRINSGNDEFKQPHIKKLPLLKELKTIKNTFEHHSGIIDNNQWIRNFYLRIDNAINSSRKAVMPVRKNADTCPPVIFDMSLINVSCTWLASYLIERASFSDIYHKRANNFQYLYHELCRGYTHCREPEFLQNRQGNCVFGFPVIAKNKRVAIHELKRRGIQTFTFGEELYRHCAEQVDRYLVHELFFVPVHQDLTSDDLKFIVENLKAVLADN